jgi:hypothetical protein
MYRVYSQQYLRVACGAAGVAQPTGQPLIQLRPPKGLQSPRCMVQQLLIAHDGHGAVRDHRGVGHVLPDGRTAAGGVGTRHMLWQECG